MKAAAPLLALVGVFALTTICITGDAAMMRSAATSALRRKLLVKEVDSKLGELDGRLASVVERINGEGVPANYSQGEFLASVLQEMQDCVRPFTNLYDTRSHTWSVTNRTDSERVSYVLTLSLVVVPEDGVEVGFTKSYLVSVQIRQEC